MKKKRLLTTILVSLVSVNALHVVFLFLKMTTNRAKCYILIISSLAKTAKKSRVRKCRGNGAVKFGHIAGRCIFVERITCFVLFMRFLFLGSRNGHLHRVAVFLCIKKAPIGGLQGTMDGG